MSIFSFGSSQPAPGAPILTPCIGVCALDQDGYCEGCFRKAEEIGRWASLSDSERQWYMDQVLPEREARRNP